MIILRQHEYSDLLTKGLAKVYKTLYKNKPPRKAKRTTIKKRLEISNKLKDAKMEAQMVAINPGNSVARGVGKMIEYPLSTSSNVAGKVGMAVDPTGVGLYPIGMAGTAGEGILRKKFPKYKKITENLAKKYKESKVPGYIEGGTNALVNTLKAFSEDD